ncbi:MAG: urease accessory protein UreF [Actinobacteria bacterium]|nr:urease accessory protein UreF [Actinomycetota bacterium]
MDGPPVNAMLLADGRFPAGGHAHSGGMESAVAAGRVTDIDSLARFLRGRLSTAGLSAAALAAAASVEDADWRALDTEADARTPSAAVRWASRRQGKQLIRTAKHLWPGRLDVLAGQIPQGPHHPVAMGAAVAAAGLGAADAARCTAFNAVAGPAGAAVRLLGIDPVQVHGLLAELAEAIEQVVEPAAACAAGEIDILPCPGSVLLDLFGEQHAISEVKLFAS